MTASDAAHAQALRTGEPRASDETLERPPHSNVRVKGPSASRDERLQGRGDPDHSPASLRAGFAHVVHQVIPELLRAHPSIAPALRPNLLEAEAAQAAPEGDPPTAAEVDGLTREAVAGNGVACDRFLEEARERGRSRLWLITDLIPAVARRLGTEWEEDVRSFTDVSIGVSTLQRAMRRLSASEGPAEARPVVVLSCLADEQHTLGLFTLGAALQHRGWPTHVETGLNEDDLLELRREQPLAAFGLSVNHDDLIPDATALCLALREQAPDLGLLVGGTAELRGLASKTGAVICTGPDQASAWLADLAPRM